MKVDLTVNKSRGVQRTDIEWADYSANPIRAVDRQIGEVGWACRKVSAGCANCYAEALNNRFGNKHPYTATGLGQVDQVLDEGVLRKLLTMRPRGPFKNGRERPAVFLGDMMDLFYGDAADEKAAKAAGVPFAPIPFEMLDRLFAVMALRTDIDFLLLTKRPERMAEYFSLREWAEVVADMRALGQQGDELARRFANTYAMNDLATNGNSQWGATIRQKMPEGWPLPNVWLGTSVEDQAAADLRIPHLLRCPAAVRFLSCEPLLGPVDLNDCDDERPNPLVPCPVPGDQHWENRHENRRTRCTVCDGAEVIDWVIVGGESGRGARPCDLEWNRGVLEQCREAKVPCFVKQLGSNPSATLAETGTDENDYDNVERLGLNDPKGGDKNEWPKDLRVREMPGATNA